MRFGPRVLETTTTTGTGSYALGGAVSGRQTFASGVGTGTLTAYFAVDSAGTSWEMGYGTLSSGPATLTRAAVLASTNSNNAVDWAAGTKYIMSVLPDAVIQSLLKNHAGSAKPAWLPTSGLWVDNSATPHILYYWDGTDSIPVAKMNATTNFAWAEGAKGADIASAGTTNLATATGSFVHVTGTTTITAFGTANAGVTRIVRFAGALTLTHNGTSLILPGGANITTAANDVAVMVSEGSGNWRCVSYTRASGLVLINSPTIASLEGLSLAQGDILYATAADTLARLAKGTAAQQLRMNSGATAPEWFTPLWTQSYESAEQSIAYGDDISLTHSLGGIPKHFSAVLRCKTTDLGYAVGDEVSMPVSRDGGDQATYTIFVNSTNIGIAMGAQHWQMPTKTGGAPAAIDAADWRILLRAWR